MAEKQLIDGAWYWVRFETGFKDEWTQAPAVYRSGGDAWYSFLFAGIPARKVEVLGKIDAPDPADVPLPPVTPEEFSRDIAEILGDYTPAAKAEVQTEPVAYRYQVRDTEGKHVGWLLQELCTGRDGEPLYTAPQAEPMAGNNAAWAEGFSAGESWRQDVVTFWETNDYGKSPAQPVNPYPAIAPQATQPGADALPEIKDMQNSPQCLNLNDRAFWMLGWNECRDAARYAARAATQEGGAQ